MKGYEDSWVLLFRSDFQSKQIVFTGSDSRGVITAGVMLMTERKELKADLVKLGIMLLMAI